MRAKQLEFVWANDWHARELWPLDQLEHTHDDETKPTA